MSTKRLVLLVVALLAACLLPMWCGHGVSPPAPSEPASATTGSPQAPVAIDTQAPNRQEVGERNGQESTHVSETAEVGARGTISVVDADYKPLADAQVHLCTSLGHASPHSTNPAGLATVQWPADAQLELYAWKAGYSVEVVDLQSPFPADLTLVLLDEGAVYGSVVLPDGHTAGQGIRVVAAPTHERSPGRRVFERACQGDPYACASTTDANGAYMINRLGRGREYSLLASGGGVSTSARVGPIAAGDQVKHDITVRTVYSLAVDLYDARTKQRLTVSPHFRYGTGFRVSLKGTELELADVVMSAKPFFANCSTFKRGLANSIDDYFLSDSLLPEAGPISVKVALPGYQPWSGSLNAKRLSDVAERQRIELTPAAYGFGSLVLILPSCLRRPAPQADLFTATLTLVSDGAKSIQFKVDPTESGRVEFDGIPYGSYAASLAGFCQGGTYPAAGGTPPVVTIGESPTLLEIPELYLGSLLLDPQRPDGSSYAGYLDALVLEGAGPVDEIPRPASSRVFLGPPYRLDILNPGEYTIVLNYPVGSEAHVVCSVSSNSETRCLLHVP